MCTITTRRRRQIFLHRPWWNFGERPQIVTWQQELWLTHCNDFMAYIGTWEPRDFYANTLGGDGRALFHEMTDKHYRHLWDESARPGSQRLESWRATFYAYRCLHCGKLRGNWDCD